MKIFQLQFQFWYILDSLNKNQSKIQKYFDSVPHAEPILASLVVDSKSIGKFFVVNNIKFDCCLVSSCIQNEKKEICLFIVVHCVLSSQVPFLMRTLEKPQKFAVQVLDLNFLLSLLWSLFSNYELFMYFVFASSFIHMDLSIMQTQHP